MNKFIKLRKAEVLFGLIAISMLVVLFSIFYTVKLTIMSEYEKIPMQQTNNPNTTTIQSDTVNCSSRPISPFASTDLYGNCKSSTTNAVIDQDKENLDWEERDKRLNAEIKIGIAAIEAEALVEYGKLMSKINQSINQSNLTTTVAVLVETYSECVSNEFQFIVRNTCEHVFSIVQNAVPSLFTLHQQGNSTSTKMLMEILDQKSDPLYGGFKNDLIANSVGFATNDLLISKLKDDQLIRKQ